MEIYLTIITTVLVVTQIIRLIQNHKQLKSMAETDKRNNSVLLTWQKLDKVLDEFHKSDM